MAISTQPEADVVAVSAEVYMEQYAAQHFEWVKGAAIRMSPVSLSHFLLTSYLMQLLSAYMSLNSIGRVLGEPFVMVLETTESRREPDLQVILNTNPGRLTETAMLGPADICVEVVSPESASRDYGEKFIEYEKAGVKEYWIIDPIRRRCDFNRLTDAGVYASISPDDADTYVTPLLPRLALHIPTLWQEKLPDVVAVVEAVRAMVME